MERQSFYQSTGTHVVLKAEDIAFLAAARMVANCMLHTAGFSLSELRLSQEIRCTPAVLTSLRESSG